MLASANENRNYNGVSPHTCQNGCLKKKNLQTLNAGEGLEKRKPSWTVVGNVRWYNHYGEQYGESLKN